MGHKDIYAGIGVAAKEGGPYNRLKKETAVGYLGVVADLDIFWPGHKEKGKDGKPYPPDVATVTAFLGTLPLKPTLLVSTGHGVQAIWLYSEMQPYHSKGASLPHRVALAWGEYLNDCAAERGWTAFDTVADVPRIVRVPGTINAKDAEHPVETRLLEAMGWRYTPQDFLDALGVTADGLPDMTEEEAEANGPVSDEQRFTAAHPCPICRGYKDLPQGEGVRCWGFLSRDGNKVFCTREEYTEGGVEIETDAGTLYMHDLPDDADDAGKDDKGDKGDKGDKPKSKAKGAKTDSHIHRLTRAGDEAFAKPEAELFNTALGDLYARLPVASHYETMLIRSRAMRLYLSLVYLAKYNRPCSSEALAQYIEILEGKARYRERDKDGVHPDRARVAGVHLC